MGVTGCPLLFVEGVAGAEHVQTSASNQLGNRDDGKQIENGLAVPQRRNGLLSASEHHILSGQVRSFTVADIPLFRRMVQGWIHKMVTHFGLSLALAHRHAHNMWTQLGLCDTGHTNLLHKVITHGGL